MGSLVEYTRPNCGAISPTDMHKPTDGRLVIEWTHPRSILARILRDVRRETGHARRANILQATRQAEQTEATMRAAGLLGMAQRYRAIVDHLAAR